jgi:hypothetical protein
VSARGGQQMLLPSRSKGLIEVVEIAKEGYNVHGSALEKDRLGNDRVDHFASPAKDPADTELTLFLTASYQDSSLG